MQNRIWSLCDAYLPPILWAGVIFLFSAQSSLPGLPTSYFDFFFKKSAHMFVYGVLYFLLYRGVNLHKLAHRKNWIVPFIIAIAYAVTDELHQMFTPNRHPTYMDVGYDTLGMTLAFLRIYRYI